MTKLDVRTLATSSLDSQVVMPRRHQGMWSSSAAMPGAVLLTPDPFSAHLARSRRRHSAQDLRLSSHRSCENDHDDRSKNLSVEIATALPPEHFDPPPQYSFEDVVMPHEEEADAAPPGRNGRDDVGELPLSEDKELAGLLPRIPPTIPVINITQDPTPVSPINTLDRQYIRAAEYEENITIDSLLGHALLQPSR